MTSQNKILSTYPDCDKDPAGCFERYLRDRIEHMKDMELCKMEIGTFNDTHDHIFHKVANDINSEGKYKFWWNPHSWNVGTIKDRYVYCMRLYLKKL